MSEQTNNTKDKTRRSIRSLLVNIAIVVVLFGALQWWQARPLASGLAPQLIGLGVDGAAQRLQNLRGETVLVHFWAVWCPVCNASDGSIQSIAGDYPVISVAMQSGGPGDIREHMASQGLDFPAIPDPRGEISGDWGVKGVPTSFVIDPQGNIVQTSVGYTTEAGLRARLWAAENFQ